MNSTEINNYYFKFMNIKPLDDRVLIEPNSQEEKTKSGIVIPDTSDKEKPEQGKVIAVGPGRIDSNGKRIPMTVKEGDVVLFTKYGPSEVKVDKKEYLIAKEEDILAILS
jgi:chaperonin GroES